MIGFKPQQSVLIVRQVEALVRQFGTKSRVHLCKWNCPMSEIPSGSGQKAANLQYCLCSWSFYSLTHAFICLQSVHCFMCLNPNEFLFSQDACTPCAKAPTAHANAQCLSQEVPGLPHLLAQFLSSSNWISSVPIVSAQLWSPGEPGRSFLLCLFFLCGSDPCLGLFGGHSTFFYHTFVKWSQLSW
jgi:hypothetical protein